MIVSPIHMWIWFTDNISISCEIKARAASFNRQHRKIRKRIIFKSLIPIFVAWHPHPLGIGSWEFLRMRGPPWCLVQSPPLRNDWDLDFFEHRLQFEVLNQPHLWIFMECTICNHLKLIHDRWTVHMFLSVSRWERIMMKPNPSVTERAPHKKEVGPHASRASLILIFCGEFLGRTNLRISESPYRIWMSMNVFLHFQWANGNMIPAIS